MTILNINDIQGHDSFVRKVMTNKDLTVTKEFFLALNLIMKSAISKSSSNIKPNQTIGYLLEL